MSDPFEGLPRDEQGKFSPKHGQYNSPTYLSWAAMHKRCRQHPRYIGRVKVCERWSSFEKFLEDMGARPDNTTLDRFPNKTGDYEPTNCRWASWIAQQRNRSDNLLLTAGSETKCLAAWMEQSVVSRRTVSRRLGLGWSIDRAISESDRRRP